MIDRGRLLDTFLTLVRISSPSGAEREVAAAIRHKLGRLGVEVRGDEAGNLIAQLDGIGVPLMLTAHMDTVTPCTDVRPVVHDDVVYSDGTTVLGADDKSGLAVILEVVETILRQQLAHRPLDLVFTVREEVGLEGAKEIDRSLLRATMGIGLDAEGPPGSLIVRAPSQNSLWAQVSGRSAHAGVNPEDGINAIRVAAEAVAEMPLGRIDSETTANIGVITGGTATNIIPDLVTLRGEARSLDERKLEQQTRAMVRALERSASASGGTVAIEVTRMYDAYALDPEEPIVALVSNAMRTLGVEPRPRSTGGGSDANVFNVAGVQTVQISTGMEAVHTTKERIALDDMVLTAQILLACAIS